MSHDNVKVVRITHVSHLYRQPSNKREIPNLPSAPFASEACPVPQPGYRAWGSSVILEDLVDSGDHFEKTVYHLRHSHLVVQTSGGSNLWIELGLAYVMC